MDDGAMASGARGTGRRGLVGLALLAALAGCSQPGVMRLVPTEPAGGPVAAAEPRLGFSGFAGMGGTPMP